MATKLIEVSAGLIFREGKLLITQRHAAAHLGGLWEFPGGKREADETFEQCLVRELREELAVEVSVGEVVADLTHAYPERTVRLKFFHCKISSGEPRPIGCPALRWVVRTEIPQFQFPAADEQLLAKLIAADDWWRR